MTLSPAAKPSPWVRDGATANAQPRWRSSNRTSDGNPGRRRDYCHFVDTPSASLLKHLLTHVLTCFMKGGRARQKISLAHCYREASVERGSVRLASSVDQAARGHPRLAVDETAVLLTLSLHHN